MVFAWTTNISHQENQPQTTRQRACDSSDIKKEVYVPAIVKKRSTKKRKDNVLRAGRPGGANGISAICKIGEEWARRWNAGDVDGVAALYSTDAVYLPPHHEAVHGRAAIREYLRMPLAHGVSNLEFAVTYNQKTGTHSLGRGNLPHDGSPEGRNEQAGPWEISQRVEDDRKELAARC